MARSIRVGGVVASGSAATSSTSPQMDLADFKTALCNKMPLVPAATCLAQIQVDVRTLSSFQNMTPPNPLSGSTFNATGLCFNSGAASSVVEFQAYYLWPVTIPMLFGALANVSTLTTSGGTTNGSWFMLSSAAVFKNEPSGTITNSSSSC